MTQTKKFFRKQFILRLNPEVTLDNALIKFLEVSAEKGKKENAIIRDLFSAYLIVNASDGKMSTLINQIVESDTAEQRTLHENEPENLHFNRAKDAQVDPHKQSSLSSIAQPVDKHLNYEGKDGYDENVNDVSQMVSSFESLGIIDSFNID